MDAPPADVSLLRKASFSFWLLAALMLLITVFVGSSLFGPNPPIVISKATTRITTPLDANGLPDYAAVLLADSRKGVTPENNGAVPFLMAMWPEEKGSNDDLAAGITYADGYTAEESKLLYTELGLSGIPPVELRVTPLQTDKNRLAVLRLLRERLPKPENLPPAEAEQDPDAIDGMGMGMGTWIDPVADGVFFNGAEVDAVKDDRVGDFLLDCEPVGRPWTAEELPFLAEWLEENNAALDLIVKGANSPEWHWPEPGLLRAGSGTLTESFPMVRYQQLRGAARLLMTRRHFYQGKGNFDKARRDAIAVVRLASHTKKGGLLMDQLISYAIGGMGFSTVDSLAADKAIPASTLRALLTELDQIGPLGRLAYAFDQGERFFALDTIVSLQNANDFDRLDVGIPASFNLVSYDWNPTLRAINERYDAIIAAAKLPTWSRRQAALAQIKTVVRMARGGLSPQTAQEWAILLTAKGRGKKIGDMWASQIAGSITDFFQIEDRSLTNRQLTRLGIALAIHRAEQGAYPESLDELVPDVLPKLPVDLFHNNPFVYRKTDDGFLLYCFGANGKDDKGSNESGIWGSPQLEGVEAHEPEQDYSTVDSDWNENGEYIGGSQIEEDADDPYAKIPAGADDMSLRVPLPAPEPWPWETTP